MSDKEKTRIHVCLVSAQPIPNLIPLRMEELRPEKVILLVSPDMKVQAERLEKVIKGWAIKVEKVPIAAYVLESARKTCMHILSQNDNAEIILNATGGTKIMAFAAFEVFREWERKIIYVDTQNIRIDVLSPAISEIEFNSKMKIGPYLASYGQYIISETAHSEINPTYSAVSDKLIKNAGNLEKGLSILNRIASGYKDIRTFPFAANVGYDDLKDEQFHDVIIIFSDSGILGFDGNAVTFPELSSVEFASGGWLEEYVYRTVSSLNPTDVKMNVKISWDIKKRRPDNEYDVVFTLNNRLYLIECKTKRFQGKDVERAGEESIYKLDNLRDAAGGLFGKGMLVSYRRLTEAQKRRLRANRLEFCDVSDIKNLSERLKQWIK